MAFWIVKGLSHQTGSFEVTSRSGTGEEGETWSPT